jgi:uncharacterized repeat protein (TIGR03843 family)
VSEVPDVEAAGVPGGDPPDLAAALELLTEGELEVLGRIPWASNATLLARVRNGESTSLAIYKPRRGEQPLWDFPDGTLYRREVAAYLVSEALAWGLVPPTMARGGPFGIGSVQLYVEADAQLTAFELVEQDNPAMPLVAAFDVVVNNADRKGGHCLAETVDGRVWAIDHGVCFHEEPKLRTVLWDFAGQALPPGVVADLDELAATIRDGALGRDLCGLLEPDEITALGDRASALISAGCFPLPSGRRPYPWPLV